MSPWVVPAIVIFLNALFGVIGYFLGKSHQRKKDSSKWLEKFEQIKEVEERTKELLQEQMKKLEREKILFEQAAWNEKLKILDGKK